MCFLARIGMTHYLLAFVIFMVCLLLTVIILLQRGRGEGLASAFGGGSGSAFGAKTGDMFTWITVGFAFLYLILNVAGNYVFRPAVAAEEPQPQLTTFPPETSDMLDELIQDAETEAVPGETSDTEATPSEAPEPSENEAAEPSAADNMDDDQEADIEADVPAGQPDTDAEPLPDAEENTETTTPAAQD